MSKFLYAACLVLGPQIAVAGSVAQTTEAISRGYAGFAAATAELAQTAEESCAIADMTAGYHTAYDAWMGVSHVTFGPIEEAGRALAITFWPDPKDRVGKALRKLSGAQDPVVADPDEFLDVSVAAQGLTALEHLLFAESNDADYACALRRAAARALAQRAQDLEAEWPEFAALLTAPDTDASNGRFQSQDEVHRALYTALSTGLEFLRDQRLGRPLGSFDKPRPKRAEARRSARSQRNAMLSLQALQEFAASFAPGPTPETTRLFDQALSEVQRLDDPDFAGVAQPISRLRIEALQNTVRELQEAVADEIGAPLGISAGFNALDGD